MFATGTTQLGWSSATWWATPIIASGTPLGTLLVRRADLKDLEQRTLERAAQVTAGLILNERAVAEAEQRVRGELLDALLSDEGYGHDLATRRAALVGVDLDRSHVVGAIAVRDADLPLVARIASAQAAEQGGVAGVASSRVAVILPGERAVELVTAFARRLTAATGGVLTAAAEGSVGDPAMLAEAFRSARRCADAMVVLGRDGETADAADVRFYSLLLANKSTQDVDAFITSTLGPVLEHDPCSVIPRPCSCSKPGSTSQ